MGRRFGVSGYVCLLALSCGNDPAQPGVVGAGDGGTPDTTPPTFAGIKSAAARSGTEAVVTWDAATDDTTPFSRLRYAVYVATAAGGEDFAKPALVTAPGVTSVVLDDLTPTTTYYVVVRATDAAGNRDPNTSELSVTTTAVIDKTPPSFDGLESATPMGATAIALSWQPAIDDKTPSSEIVYDVYASEAPGLEDYATPTKTTAAGTTQLTIDGLAPSEERFFVVRARDAAGNHDTNRSERSARTPDDVAAPVFTGATSVSDPMPTGLTVNWDAATDDITPASAIKYSVCQTPVTGGCLGALFHVTSTVVGATSLPMLGLTPGKHYDFVVRAEDAARNRDTNTAVVSGDTISDTAPPSFTSDVTAAPLLADDPFGARKLVVSWNPATDDVWPASAISYRVCWNVDPTACAGSGFTIKGVTSPGQTTFTATLLQPYTQYTVFVRAIDGTGNAEAGDHSATGTTAVSYLTNIEGQIFSAPSTEGGCSGGASCHSPSLSRANTVGVDVADCSGFSWVRPGDPASSLVYLKMANLQAAACGGAQMPAGGPFDQPLGAPYPNTVTKTKALFDWITQGAHEN
jgi:hypothetical protein